MKRRLHLLRRLPLFCCLLVAPLKAQAQELYNYSVGLLGTLGGSPDARPGNSLQNTGYQINLQLVTEPRTLVGFRAGKLSLDKDGQLNALRDAELTYATVGGEYRARQSYFDSGVFLGIGGYRLQGTPLVGRRQSDSSWGLTAGVTSEFPINSHLGILLELSGHYADLNEVQFFVMGHGGVAIHF